MERHEMKSHLRMASLATVLLLTLGAVARADGEQPAPAPVQAEPAPVVLVPETRVKEDRLATGFQSTYIWQHKFRMPAEYTDPGANSLTEASETGYTLSATLFLGARPWRNTEIFVNPEVIQTIDISGLHGLGGMSNSENQKGGKESPTLYLARAFVRQTIPLGGETAASEAGQNQFASLPRSRRLVLTAGLMSLLDVFDANPYVHDGRTQFMNWALLSHGAFDFAADTRGYTWGIATEYFFDAWAFRLGRYLVPKESNGMALDFNLFAHYGDNAEVEHRHAIRGLPGAIRFLAFHNHERMAAFTDAVAAAAGGTPTLTGVRRDQDKYGIGLTAEQAIHRDGGIFLRASLNDGRTETYAFSEIERSLALGATVKGTLWRRSWDAVGAAWVGNGLSGEHRSYLAQGGLGFLIGDGQLTNYRPEQIVEVYYCAATFHGLWVTLDYQHIANPAYNADRGPVNFLGVRLHLEM